MSFLFTTKNITEMPDLWGREGPGTPGDDIVTDGGGGRVNQWVVEQFASDDIACETLPK